MERQRQNSRTSGMAVYERLLMIEVDLETIARLPDLNQDVFPETEGGTGSWLKRRFNAVASIEGKTIRRLLLGEMETLPPLMSHQIDHLESGTSLVAVGLGQENPRIYMAHTLGAKSMKRAVVGEVKGDYLWGLPYENNLGPGTDYCVLDDFDRVLHCSFPPLADLWDDVSSRMSDDKAGAFQFDVQGGSFLASYRPIFLKSKFQVPMWTVVVTKQKANVLQPIADFQRTIPLIILGCLCLVAFLGMKRVCRSLLPLKELEKGAQQIAVSNFDTRLQVTSGDEFESLARSFNDMAEQLSVREQAEATARARLEFLVNVSHEIRTPMTAIVGFADLLRDPDLSERERGSFIRTIRRSGNHLLRIVNDILDLARVESGKMRIERIATGHRAQAFQGAGWNHNGEEHPWRGEHLRADGRDGSARRRRVGPSSARRADEHGPS
jgi:hypothetical protein